jgi:hypothetical protein
MDVVLLAICSSHFISYYLNRTILYHIEVEVLVIVIFYICRVYDTTHVCCHNIYILIILFYNNILYLFLIWVLNLLPYVQHRHGTFSYFIYLFIYWKNIPYTNLVYHRSPRRHLHFFTYTYYIYHIP